MVIACPECSTKFRVNPERIPDRGAKVRCARCKHVFLVQKPLAETPVFTPEEPLGVPTPAVEKTAEVEEHFPQTGSGLSAPAAESDFSYDQFHNLDQTPQEEETFSFSTEPVAKSAAGDATARDEFTFGDEAEEPLPEAADADTAPAGTPVAEADTTAARGHEGEAKPAKSKKRSPLGSVIRVLLLLVLGLLIVGGVLYYQNGPEQFEQSIRQLLGQAADRPAQTGKIALNKLEGKFIKNREVGELFIIRGEAINKFREPRASIQVKGVIFDHSGKSLLQKTIFCGNPISDQELQTLPFSKIEELMSNQFGKSLSNMNVNSEQAIPFTIVFRDLPKSLAEFSVNIASSKPATQ